jgi:rSAM/selenodomain-associated transferase 2
LNALSIVIPVLDDAPALGALLASLRDLFGPMQEIVVVDGGSTDDSAAVASRTGVPTLVTSAGRAHQLACGVAAARGDWIWMLHADCAVPPDVAHALMRVIRSGRTGWGRFDVRLSGSDWRLRIVEWAMNLRSRTTGIATGDQGIFVHRALLAAAGGIPDVELMEDIRLSQRLKRKAPPICLRERLVASSRRWERDGVLRTVRLMWRLRLLHALGVAPRHLRRLYYGN